MFAKLLLLAVLVTLVSSQSTSTCTSTSFTFWNGYPGGINFAEQEWDYTAGSFSDGSDDAFDGFFDTEVSFDGTIYASSSFYLSPVEFFCDVGTTDSTSSSVARYTYNFTEIVQLRREFFAPRATTWIRVVDTIENFGTVELNITLRFSGDYGSDEGTLYAVLNDFYWVSSDGADGTNDPPVSVNIGTANARVAAEKPLFLMGQESVTWEFTITLGAGESVNFMHIIGQYNNLSDAILGGAQINALDDAIFQNLTVRPDSIVNWDLCAMLFTVEEPQDFYCDVPANVAIRVSHDDALTFNGESVTANNREVTVSVRNGTNTFSYHRLPDGCPARTTDLEFVVPSTEVSATVDTSGAWPVVNPSGGFGAPYKLNLELTTDFADLFGSTVQVTVYDSKMCSNVVEVTIPDEPNSGNTPGVKVAAASQVIGSAVAFAAAMLVL